jgi:hypothetical protein
MQGANHSDSRRYREDLQRSMTAILGVFMKRTANSGHQLPPWLAGRAEAGLSNRDLLK